MSLFQYTFTPLRAAMNMTPFRRFFILVITLAALTGAASAEAQKSRILIISGMTDEQTTAFYGRMNERNGKVDRAFRPQKLDQADIVVYLLKSWDELAQAPGARQLPDIFSRVQAIDKKATSHSVWANLTSGHPLRFIFFSLEAAGYPGLTCYADYIAREVDRSAGDEFSNPYLRDCKS